MRFWPTFFGSFYSERPYVDARLIHTGFALRYSVFLALMTGLSALVYIAISEHWTQFQPSLLVELGVIFGIALVCRAAMLLPLTIAARLLAHAFKMPLTNAQAARLTAVAYGPVAFFDAVGFCVAGHAVLQPPYLFGLGIAMLLAALNAAK